MSSHLNRTNPYPGYYLPCYSPAMELERRERKQRLQRDMMISRKVTNDIINNSKNDFVPTSIYRSSQKRISREKTESYHPYEQRSSKKQSLSHYINDNYNPENVYMTQRKSRHSSNNSREIFRTT